MSLTIIKGTILSAPTLGGIQACIHPAFFHQLFVVALFDDVAVLKTASSGVCTGLCPSSTPVPRWRTGETR